MIIKLQLIPINETTDSINIITVSLDKVEYLAFIAINLIPIDAYSEIDGLTGALWEEMQTRKFHDKELFTIYDKLIHATNGFSLLKTTIQLFLIEKDMRYYGISKDIVAKYDTLQLQYSNLIDELKI